MLCPACVSASCAVGLVLVPQAPVAEDIQHEISKVHGLKSRRSRDRHRRTTFRVGVGVSAIGAVSRYAASPYLLLLPQCVVAIHYPRLVGHDHLSLRECRPFSRVDIPDTPASGDSDTTTVRAWRRFRSLLSCVPTRVHGVDDARSTGTTRTPYFRLSPQSAIRCRPRRVCFRFGSREGTRVRKTPRRSQGTADTCAWWSHPRAWGTCSSTEKTGCTS